MEYNRALDAAIDAAVEAGALLRREFHRSGGPRGSRHHADADTEAERIIYDRLAAFPSYGYVGEELGAKRTPHDGAPVWLVDPNDGTSAFTSGYRGPAVSIALVHNGLPVLGVVYAYSAPDDRGDLITWAEACGPVRRNGQAVTREWPSVISSEFTVLLAHPADRNPRANGRAVAPMRFRAVPSIAYRLALVAAGKGDATVSLQSPSDWDYAAGHALLRGAGGDLYDSSTRPIRYSRAGRTTGGEAIFAGSPTVAGYLSKRNWQPIFERSNDADPLCRPTSGEAVADAELLSRAQGCLLGQLCGDSLGSLVEFKSAEEILRNYPEGVRLLHDGGTFGTLGGQPTDDSEMALTLARLLIANRDYDPKLAREGYVNWYKSGPFDIGSTTRSGLDGKPNLASEANGALMRISPVGIAGAAHGVDRASEWARSDAAITHPNPVCVDASAAYAAALAFAIASGASANAVYQKALSECREESVRSVLIAASDRAPADYQTHQGWVLVALQNAFYQLLHAPGFQEGIVDSVMHGGDTDTNGAIAGALLGAVHGRAAVPPQWLDRVLSCRPMEGFPG